ncbi:MAG: succinate--CoA ligase subunit beta, partial [Candidatus Saccharicenans sp.]
VSQAFELLISDEQVDSALINIFGGIVRCDLVARGVINSARKLALKKPVVVRLQGTNVDQGKQLLELSGLPFYFVDSFEEAARLTVSLSKKKTGKNQEKKDEHSG